MKKILISLLIIGLFFRNISVVLADDVTVINNGITYLKSQQDSTGKITGFGGESEWAAIGFAANNVDVSTVKNPTISLKDYILNNPPSDFAPATDWERKILAIVAIGGNPSNFDGTNYIQKLEGYANSSQIGDVNLLNDDIFGLLALTAGSSTNSQIKQDILNFIIAHQNSDGGFSWSTVSPTNTSDGNDTAAAIQALEAAKNNSLTSSNLDSSITNAKNYLLTTQKNDGGFGYDSSSNSDGSSTTWALMAFNVLNMSSSTQAINAKSWIVRNQESDGGFHYQSGSGSDTYTSSHALIALSGKSWILNIYNSSSPSSTPSATPTPTATPSATPSPTPTPTLTSSPSPTPTPTLTPTPTPVNSSTTTPSATPTSTPSPTTSPELKVEEATFIQTPSPSPSPQVLGEAISLKDEPNQQQLLVNGFKSTALPVAGMFSLFTTFKFLEGRRWKR